MPTKLARSLSRPFADLDNLLRPRTLSPKKGVDTAEDEALKTPPSVPLNLRQTDTPSFAPTLEDDYTDDFEAPFSFRNSFESRQWKECTPILDDPIGEALAEQSLAFSRLPSGAFSQAQASESASGDCTVDDEIFESPEKCRRRSHSWHALNLASGSTAENSFADETMSPNAQDDADKFDLHELDASSEYSTRPPSSLDERDLGPRRQSEDSGGTVSTPNTSVPLVGVAGDTDAFPFQQTSTPPRPAGHFVELIETCPTPPSTSENAADVARRRSLLTTSGLGIDYSSDEEGAPGDLLAGKDGSRMSSRASTRLSTRPSSHASNHAGSRASCASTPLARPQPEQLPLVEPNSGSYSSSAYADAAHYDSYTRNPRLRRSVTRIFDASEADVLFPEPEEVVEALLALPHGRCSPSAMHLSLPADSFDGPAPPKHVRPVPAPPTLAELVSSASHRHPSAVACPFASLLPPPTARAHARTAAPALRYQTSQSTLFTWDLAHLPAPRTPREAPFRVRWQEVVAPTACLRTGRGSGRCGDVWGAVERCAEDKGDHRARDTRRRTALPAVGLGLGGLRRSLSRVGRRASSFAERLTVQPEDESVAGDAERVDEFALPAAQLRHARGGGLSRAGSFASVREGLSRFGRRMSWAPSVATSEAGEDEDDDEKRARKAQRRRSLAASLFGGVGRVDVSVEDLSRWVSVVVR
ncbi:hypothetical protein JCM3770_003033 [Rhodotorula araucariae]